MTELFNTDLYDQRIDAMKARERQEDETHAAITRFTQHLIPLGDLISEQDMRDIDRRLAYKRKRAAWGLEGPLV